MNLNFDMKSREDAVRSVLIDAKARVLAETDRFDVTFSRMDFLKEGFGFKFKIEVRGKPDARAFQEFSEIRHYVGETFDYMFNGALSVSAFVEASAAEYEITSAY